ncbi:MAG: [FeFe] hydrogenase, group A [Eubacteriaceae bacterium]|nr:[FeFe] hydrogenase, group A [Eubacteriaceae bacterium]
MNKNTKFITINGEMTPFTDEKNVLEVIRKAGIDIPTFCYYSDLSTYGACRMCIVEDDKGRIMTSCSTPPKDGMIIKTNTKKLHKHRRLILKMLLSSHCRECTTCSRSGNCSLQTLSRRLGIDKVQFDKSQKALKTWFEVDKSSKSIVRDQNKCIHCGDCVRMCSEIQNVGAIDFVGRGYDVEVSPAFGDPIAATDCVNCGQCAAVCPTGAIDIKNQIKYAWNAIDDPELRTIVQVAPAVRSALGEMFGLSHEENVMPLMVAALRKLGFDEIYDTSFGADLTVVEESNEFLRKLENGEKLPLFTSCCPGWIRYVENRHPELMPQISSCKSPMGMFSAVVKEEPKVNAGHMTDTRKPFVVAIMPCTAKKDEAARDEFTTDGEPDTDLVLTTQELGDMIIQAGIEFDMLEPEACDLHYGMFSGAGVIFGVTGGVTEAVVRRLVDTKDNNTFTNISFSGVRGLEGVKDVHIPYKDMIVKIAIVNGLANAEELIRKIEAGEAEYHFVEVMACPSGCIAGGGQPRSDREIREERSDALYMNDKLSRIRHSDANPFITRAYRVIIKDNSHKLLHVHYPTSEQGAEQ